MPRKKTTTTKEQTTPSAKEAVLMDDVEIKRALNRIATEIVENNKGTKNLVLIGIIERGVHLAKRLAKHIQQHEGGAKPSVGSLDISLYRDDLNTRGKYITVKKSHIPFSEMPTKCTLSVVKKAVLSIKT